MHPHRRTIDNLYNALAQLDTDAIADCYASDAVFDDEVFSLQGKREVTAMWRMLCDAVLADGSGVWRLCLGEVQASADSGQAHWEADYCFRSTGRLVHNSVEARFAFNRMGLIVQHRDRFDFWHWARQALGAPGVLLGWSPVLRTVVQRSAAAQLRRYMARGSG